MIPTSRQIAALLVAGLLSTAESANQEIYLNEIGTRTSGYLTTDHQDNPIKQTGRTWPLDNAEKAITPDPRAYRTTILSEPGSQDHLDGKSTTPEPSNAKIAYVESYGNACNLPGNHLLGLPELRATSRPHYGSSEFSFALDHTTGVFGEYVILGLSAASGQDGQASTLPSSPNGTCHEAIDPSRIIVTQVLPTKLLTTDIPMPLDRFSAQVIGQEIHVQALVIELLPEAELPYQGISNALRVIIGK